MARRLGWVPATSLALLLLSAFPVGAQTCPGLNGTKPAPFQIPDRAIDQLDTKFPVVAMVLSNVSNGFKNPIFSNHVSGGTSLINPPRGYRYKATICASATRLAVDIVFIPIPVGKAPSTAPPQIEQPAPAPTRIQITLDGKVTLSALSRQDTQAVPDYSSQD